MTTTSEETRRRGLVIDAERPWRLSHVLKGHTQDVKSVCASALPGGEVELIHSASRDETARSWYRHTTQGLDTWRQGATYAAKRYQNAVAHVPGIGDAGLSILGGLDSRILSYETQSMASEKPQSKPRQVLNDHHDNVCHLSTASEEGRCLLISASWDATARVYEHKADSSGEWKLVHTLKGHERAVWDAGILSSRAGEERYLTTSADLFVRLWKRDEIEAIYRGHSDVVRGLAILPPHEGMDREMCIKDLPELHPDEELFVTSSNDGSLRVWSLDESRRPSNNKQNGGDALRVLVPKDAQEATLVYDVASLGSSRQNGGLLVVSCGEDGLLRGWNVDTAEVDFSIPQPVTSVWSVAVLPISGDIVTGSSDGMVRIFTQRAPHHEDAPQSVLALHDDAIPEADQDELEEHLRRCEAISAKRRVRSEVVQRESMTEEGDSNNFEGKKYDAILRIDVSDDAEPLPLPINRGGEQEDIEIIELVLTSGVRYEDDHRVAAKAFLERHGLPESYEDQIVEFISVVGPDSNQ